MGDTRGNTIYIREEDVKDMPLDKLAKMTRDNNVVFCRRAVCLMNTCMDGIAGRERL